MKILPLWTGALLALAVSACTSTPKETENTSATVEYGNPAAPGFNEAGSDPKAIALADSVMKALGGRKAWDDTRYIQWNFLGRRNLLWDKHAQRARIEDPNQELVYILDLENNQGQIAQHGQLLEDQKVVDSLVARGKSMWINDSYWLVMPFKLKDSGVTLKYQGEAYTKDSTAAEVIQLTFENVGDTPDNRYRIYIDPATYRVAQWEFFRTADSETPAIQSLWQDYRRYGNILLSGKREQYLLDNIAVMESVADSLFQSTELLLGAE